MALSILLAFAIPLASTPASVPVRAADTVVVTYVYNDGATPDSAIDATVGELLVQPPDPTFTGHVFGGWYSDPELTTLWDFGTRIVETATTLYAKWALNQYTITFHSNGGSAVSAITQDYGTAVTAPADPTREGYAFAGWYTDDGTFLEPYVVPDTMPDAYVDAYAMWTVNRYDARYVKNNGNADRVDTYDYGADVAAPPNPTRSGYAFAGWYLDDGTFLLPAAFPFPMPIGGVTLYAKWTANLYTISFQSNGGSAVSAVTQAYQTQVAAPTPPTRTNYAFDGWYLDDATFLLPAAFPFAMPVGGVTLYAKWTPSVITSATFSANAASGYLSKLPAGTTVAALLAGLDQGTSVRAFNGATEITGTTLVGTGMTVKLYDGDVPVQSLTAVVTGDVSGDGKCSLLDFAQLQSHLLGRTILTGARLLGGDLSGGSTVSLLDFAQMQSYLLGRSSIVPRSQ